MCATWILRVEAEQRACKQAEMCQPGAEDAETVGLDKEGARRSAERHKHAIRHNEITVGTHREREEACSEPEERRDELACTVETLWKLPRQEAAEETTQAEKPANSIHHDVRDPTTISLHGTKQGGGKKARRSKVDNKTQHRKGARWR